MVLQLSYDGGVATPPQQAPLLMRAGHLHVMTMEIR